jgi:acyl-CoA thioester hydrolase
MHTLYRDTVRPEWVDFNCHLRDAFYMLVYSFAVDAFMDHIGLDDATRRSRNRSLFTLEAHVVFLHEIKEGAAIRVDGAVLGVDSKRIHLYMEMFSDKRHEAVSASEQMLLHVDMTSHAKSAVFDPDIAARTSSLRSGDTPTGRYAGRVIGLPFVARPASGSGTEPA